MSSGASVSRMVREYLARNGYDGLCNAVAECGCTLDDLFPCSGPSYRECRAAHKTDYMTYVGEGLCDPDHVEGEDDE